ncbi:MAG TPA: thioesterase family protein [Gemmatimonadales bacterium]|nr:thioesterase family protein [Gemmatimonadales bacterium]
MAIPPFETIFEVTPADIDERGHVNNVVYVRWVNDVAIMHWRSGATADQQADLAWVMMRHEIDYCDAALPGDRVRARTWVGHAEGLKFERFVELARVGDGKVLAESKTLWCPVDCRTGRPKRVPAGVRARFSVE